MSFPYINAFQQFFDSSGDPLVSGTIEFRDPTSNNLINSYPTATDADAQTNANDNPLTLNSYGAAATGLFLEDGVAYKVIVKDANGATVKSDDNVKCPIVLPYATTAAETAASVTPTDLSYPPGNVLRYGVNTTPGTTDMTTAIQAAINVISQTGGTVYIPAGRYLYSTLYLYYDSTNNPNFNTTPTKAGRIALLGDGPMNTGNINAASPTFHGTSLESNITTGNSVILTIPTGGTTSNTAGMRIEGMSFRAATSGYVLQLDEFEDGAQLKRVHVYNSHASGGGITSTHFWESTWEDVEVLGPHINFTKAPASYSTGTGIYLDGSAGDGAWFDSVFSRGFNKGWDITGSTQNCTWNRCYSSINNYGFDVGASTTGLTFKNCTTELNTYRDLRTLGATQRLIIDGGNYGAPVPEWEATTAYGTGFKTTVRNGTNIYTNTTAGTSAGSGGPTGTGTGISDGTCVWDFEVAEAESTYAAIELHDDTVQPNIMNCKIAVDSGCSGIKFVEDNSIEPLINDVYFKQQQSSMSNAIGIDASGSTTTGKGESNRCRFDSALTTDIDTPEALLYWTDTLGKRNIRVRNLATTGLVSISQDDVVQITGNTQTITGLVSGEGQGREVTVIWGGTGIDLTHNATSFKLAGGKDVIGAQGTWKFVTVDGTNWREVSRSVDTAVQTYTPTNVSADRSYDADTVAVAELADVVGTLIADLQAKNIIG